MIKLRKIEISDLENYQYWKLPIHKYHSLNGPYFKKKTDKEVRNLIEDMRSKFGNTFNNPLSQKKLISNDENHIIGEVSWYWRSEETLWIEIGIVIFDEQYWGKGIGYKAMKLWITELFDTKQEIVRLGFTTWSGNIGMIKLAKKLKMKKEAEYRKARIVNGKYYDSVSFGILKEEWSKKTSSINKESKRR